MRYHTILIVSYHCQLWHSAALQSLAPEPPYPNQRLLLWSNSTVTAEERAWLQHHFAAYSLIHIVPGKNWGLAAAYNHVIANYITPEDYLTLLDQDTLIPQSYWHEMNEAMQQQWPLILPQLWSSNRLMSPGRRWGARGYHSQSMANAVGVVSSRRLVAMNSGMTLSGRFLSSLCYPDALFVYGTDSWLMRQYESRYPSVWLLQSRLQHNLAEAQLSYRSDVYRAKQLEMIQALGVIYNHTRFERFLTRCYQQWYRLRLWWRCR
ncbi:glycosyltransferase [Ectothiorhodospiraceae bacterium BW-2]|nr:glycosyltransferase [Ectothiorhodospiraceae bacterium BW-2]